MIQPWHELSRKTVFAKYGRGIEEVVFRMPDGVTRDFYLQKESDAVCALALTPTQDVILARQLRPGPQEILLELPGGMLDDGEDPATAMARELLEETGYAGTVEVVGWVFTDAYTDMEVGYRCLDHLGLL